MRRVLSFALVVLLVLRGLMGTAVAEGLAPAQTAKLAHVAEVALQGGHSPQAPAVQHSAPGHTLAGHTAHAHSAAPADLETRAAVCEDGTSNACSHEHSASCPDCDICHSAMLALPAMPTRSLRVTGAVRPADAVPFASVPAARTIKPPIA